MKKIVLLGSTGSIGRSTLAVVDRFPQRLEVLALAAGSNSAGLADQVKRYKPLFATLANGEPSGALLDACSVNGCTLLREAEGLSELATLKQADAVVAAMVGAAGLRPTLDAISEGKRVALANKEVLVMAGELMMNTALDSGAQIMPVDSEHNAIFQCLEGNRRDALRRVLLCATGGPLLNRDIDELESITVEEALNHPRWVMGPKVTIDSATMMNKGLEMIEARWLFGLKPEQIHVLVHPQAIVHSMVEYIDGSIIAQMSKPDMEIPIQYCLSYPERWEENSKLLDLPAASPLEFREPDEDRFPALALAAAALREGGTMPAVLNAADEVAVSAFLEGRIGFTAITKVVEAAMERHALQYSPSLEGIIEADAIARAHAREAVERFAA